MPEEFGQERAARCPAPSGGAGEQPGSAAAAQSALAFPVHLPEHPRVVFFVSRSDAGANGARVEEVTRRVARIVVVPAAEDCRDGAGPHVIRRLDAAGALVWETRHQSLQEALWHAEWEYDVKPGAWRKEG